ncbi:CBS domain-containing protein [Macrococcus carouselicus]|uniref:CBS domain-containing protein n=1 Tax=Macrococcus carouselicus TaxID=69969 RepID=A0A9Q8FPK4_9STAP|nr:CBS domain-containing protein [Macrococcus carouselicus]TDM02223.1 CBS domain-containing protein [Macrococcus carouselicus]
MDNFERFISTFNQLHEAMKDETKRDDSFGSLFYQLKEKHPVVKAFKDEIDLARQLRNLLIHEKKDAFNIAEPTTEFINQLESIRQQIANPATVKQFNKPVVCLNIDDSLVDTLAHIKQHQLSQYPIFDGQRFLGILTDNGLTNWLASVSTKGTINLMDYRVRDVLPNDEKGASFIIVKNDMPLHEVEQTMIDEINTKGHSKLVILISDSGKVEKPQDILGIITPGDMPKVLEQL